MLLRLFHGKPARAVVILYLLLCCATAKAQYFSLDSNRKRVVMPFYFTRNLVIIKLKINNKGPFNFILDTGVGQMLITDPMMVDSINVQNKRTIKMTGL